jgi:GcrA cell cycle regulator
MQLHVESSDPAAIEFCAMLGTLGLAQQHVAQLFGVGGREVRRWRSGARRIPHGVGIVLRLLTAGTVTVAQVEQAAKAAVSVPARTNGSAGLEPLASLPGEPAPERSALARVKAATLVDSNLTTAEKVCALTSNACRWPCGDPERPDFHFCGDPVVKKPYCDHHRAMAFWPNRVGL